MCVSWWLLGTYHTEQLGFSDAIRCDGTTDVTHSGKPHEPFGHWLSAQPVTNRTVARMYIHACWSPWSPWAPYWHPQICPSTRIIYMTLITPINPVNIYIYMKWLSMCYVLCVVRLGTTPVICLICYQRDSPRSTATKSRITTATASPSRCRCQTKRMYI